MSQKNPNKKKVSLSQKLILKKNSSKKLVKKKSSLKNVNKLNKKDGSLSQKLKNTKGREIVFNGLSDFVKKIKDKELVSSINYLKKYSFEKSFPQGQKVFNKEGEACDYLLTEINVFLQRRYNNLIQEISALRKKGFDVGLLSLEAMHIPLKAKLFVAYGKKADLEKITNILDSVSSKLDETKLDQAKVDKNISIVKKNMQDSKDLAKAI